MTLETRIINTKTERKLVEELAEMITESTHDYKVSRGGHIPDWVVDNIMHKKFSTVRTISEIFGDTVYRFGLFDEGRLVSTIMVTKEKDLLTIADNSDDFNVRAQDFPHYAPQDYHNAGQFVTRKGFRNKGYAQRLIDSIFSEFRQLFNGTGISMRADPPFHDAYLKLGFRHITKYDCFLSPTSQMPQNFGSTEEFNRKYLCGCSRTQEQLMMAKNQRIKYYIFIRDF